jgi:hypothetical protein
MTYPNDPNFTYPENPTSRRETEGGTFTATTWASLAFIALLFGGVALWAHQSGDMENAAINKSGAERTTTGQGSVPSKAPATAPSKAPAAKDTAQ